MEEVFLQYGEGHKNTSWGLSSFKVQWVAASPKDMVAHSFYNKSPNYGIGQSGMTKKEWVTVPCLKSTIQKVVQGKWAVSLSHSPLDGQLLRFWSKRFCQD